MPNNASQKRTSPRKSISTDYSESLRDPQWDRRRKDVMPSEDDYPIDDVVSLDPSPQIDRDVETVTEPLDMYESSGTSHPNLNASTLTTRVIPNQGYNEPTECPISYCTSGITFPSILCIPCPCVAGSNPNCPPTCVTYHPVDPMAQQSMGSQLMASQTRAPSLPSPTPPSVSSQSMVPRSQQIHQIYNYSQFERDHHFPRVIPGGGCCAQFQMQPCPAPPPPPPPVLQRMDSQQSCQCDRNNMPYSTPFWSESPQSCSSNACCPASSNDYRYFAPRRRRRCRREYYLQISKGKCRTDEEPDDGTTPSTFASTQRTDGTHPPISYHHPSSVATAHHMMRPTNFPINFRLQKSAMDQPITRPTGLTALRSYSSTDSMSSLATNTSSKSTDSYQSVTGTGGVSNNNQLKLWTAAGNSNNSTTIATTSATTTTTTVGATATTTALSNGNNKDGENAGNNLGGSGRSSNVVFNAQPTHTIKSDRQASLSPPKVQSRLTRFGSVPPIQETAASVLRKRHNEIRMQALREMLENDIKKLKRS